MGVSMNISTLCGQVVVMFSQQKRKQPQYCFCYYYTNISYALMFDLMTMHLTNEISSLRRFAISGRIICWGCYLLICLILITDYLLGLLFIYLFDFSFCVRFHLSMISLTGAKF